MLLCWLRKEEYEFSSNGSTVCAWPYGVFLGTSRFGLLLVRAVNSGLREGKHKAEDKIILTS